MIEYLLVAGRAERLPRADPVTTQDDEYPFGDVLRDSLHYPASGFDGRPVRFLAGNLLERRMVGLAVAS